MKKGVPFEDPSRDGLCNWLGVSCSIFCDPFEFAILPIGFCYPDTCKNGDLPPRIDRVPQWLDEILKALAFVELTLLIERYAIDLIRQHTPMLR